MESRAWARENFFQADLGDLRLQRRLVDLAANIRDDPHGTLPQAVPCKSDLKASYRMLSNPKVSHEKILEPHVTATRQRCREAGEYLLIEDTTALSFSQRKDVEGMGPLTKAMTQGFLAHTNLAVRVERWDESFKPEVALVGVFGQECWSRKKAEGTRKERKKAKRKAKRTGAPSESDRWAKVLREAGSPPEHAQWTLAADRECDIFEVLSQCTNQGIGWIIRAAQNRRITGELGHVFTTVEQAPSLGTFELFLRSRPGCAARKARLEVRACRVELLPPRGMGRTHTAQATNVLWVREIDTPAGEEPLHWVLLTSWPCDTLEQARRVVGGYGSRWLIEEYHKGLKTGTRIEESQLSTAERIKSLLAIHAVVAAALLQLKLLANTHPDESVSQTIVPYEALHILERRFGRPESGWTNETTMRAIARMGGYLGRKQDGPPGWLSIWRGWKKLVQMVEGYRIAIGQESYG